MDIPEQVGNYISGRIQALARMISFTVKVFRRILTPATYNSATRTVLINQIYFTSVQILPAFLLVSAIVGSLFIGVVFQVLKDLGLVSLLGNVLMGLMVTELSPFFTVLLITLRSGAAINAEMAAMQVNREIKALEAFRYNRLPAGAAGGGRRYLRCALELSFFDCPDGERHPVFADYFRYQRGCLCQYPVKLDKFF